MNYSTAGIMPNGLSKIFHNYCSCLSAEFQDIGLFRTEKLSLLPDKFQIFDDWSFIMSGGSGFQE